MYTKYWNNFFPCRSDFILIADLVLKERDKAATECFIYYIYTQIN